nr:Hypothetical protein FSTVLC9_346 [Faustovirus]
MNAESLPELPAEIVEIIAGYNQIAFMRVNKWLYDRYRTNVAADYLKCTRVMITRCSRCDMIFSAYGKPFNVFRSQMDQPLMELVDTLWRYVHIGNSNMFTYQYQSNDTPNPGCAHPARIIAYGFAPAALPIITARAQTRDLGLLRYMRGCMPIESYKIIESIYTDIVKGPFVDNADTKVDFAFRLSNSNGCYWERIG